MSDQARASGSHGKNLWGMIIAASILVSLFFPIAGLMWYFYSLEARVSSVEVQLRARDEADRKMNEQLKKLLAQPIPALKPLN
jgi:Na+/melibiose symporter-like transporter